MENGILDLRGELRQQLQELQGRYTGLRIRPSRPGLAVVAGLVAFEVLEGDFKGVDGEFELQVEVPWSYPVEPIRVYETGGLIDEHVNRDSTLCLASPIDLELALLDEPSLLVFFERFVISFLVGFKLYRRTGRFPFGERSHGLKGILEGLAEWLDCRADERAVAACLRYFVTTRVWFGEEDCPCGKGRPLGRCHGPRFRSYQQRLGQQRVFELAWKQLDFMGYILRKKKAFLPTLQEHIAYQLGGRVERRPSDIPNIHFSRLDDVHRLVAGLPFDNNGDNFEK